MKDIRALVMDVDGTLSDGKVYISERGEIFKAFSIKDGFGIKELLPKLGIVPIIITGRISEIVNMRAKELNIIHVYQGCLDKKGVLDLLLKKLNLKYDQVAYIGDDLNDLEAMQKCAIKACPNDAVDDIADLCDFRSKFDGGNGAVRELIHWIAKLNGNSEIL